MRSKLSGIDTAKLTSEIRQLSPHHQTSPFKQNKEALVLTTTTGGPSAKKTEYLSMGSEKPPVFERVQIG